MEKAGDSRRVVALAAVVATLLMMLPPFGGAAAQAAVATGTRGGAGTNCTRRCGNISIPYPFSIEPGCYHTVSLKLTCNLSYQPAQL